MKFGETVLRRFCIRILQRRNVAYKLSKFTGKVSEDILDVWLDVAKEQIILDGDKATNRTFLSVEEPIDFLLSFRAPGAEQVSKTAKSTRAKAAEEDVDDDSNKSMDTDTEEASTAALKPGTSE